MIETLKYEEEVPVYFAHCMESNCELAESCLRYQATRFIPSTRHSIMVVNPKRPRPNGKCNEYRSDQPMKYAYGWSHLFDKLIHEKATIIKQEMLWHFGKTEFYRLKRKEKPFTPKDIKYVKQLFLKHGITDDPTFDEYQYHYAWKEVGTL